MLASTVAAATAYTTASKAMLLLQLFPAMASIDVSTPYPLFVSPPPSFPLPCNHYALICKLNSHPFRLPQACHHNAEPTLNKETSPVITKPHTAPATTYNPPSSLASQQLARPFTSIHYTLFTPHNVPMPPGQLNPRGWQRLTSTFPD